jgi:hypothetical protein
LGGGGEEGGGGRADDGGGWGVSRSEAYAGVSRSEGWGVSRSDGAVGGIGALVSEQRVEEAREGSFTL